MDGSRTSLVCAVATLEWLCTGFAQVWELLGADKKGVVDFHTAKTIIGSDYTTFITLKTKWGASMERPEVFMDVAPKSQSVSSVYRYSVAHR